MALHGHGVELHIFKYFGFVKHAVCYLAGKFWRILLFSGKFVRLWWTSTMAWVYPILAGLPSFRKNFDCSNVSFPYARVFHSLMRSLNDICKLWHICFKSLRFVCAGDKAFHGNSPRRCLSKSLTLEEAADTVLFCNSIVHDLVYKSTMIAMQKEIVGVTPIPIVTSTVGMAQAKRRNFCRGAASQRMLTYKSINSRKTVAHLHTPSSRIETTIEDQQPVMHVSVGERNELPKPEKVKSKCHCTILWRTLCTGDSNSSALFICIPAQRMRNIKDLHLMVAWDLSRFIC